LINREKQGRPPSRRSEKGGTAPDYFLFPCGSEKPVQLPLFPKGKQGVAPVYPSIHPFSPGSYPPFFRADENPPIPPLPKGGEGGFSCFVEPALGMGVISVEIFCGFAYKGGGFPAFIGPDLGQWKRIFRKHGMSHDNTNSK
jgi:hypothetical protein